MDSVLTRFAEFSIKNDIHPEISSKMENQLREYISFGGVKYQLVSSKEHTRINF